MRVLLIVLILCLPALAQDLTAPPASKPVDVVLSAEDEVKVRRIESRISQLKEATKQAEAALQEALTSLAKERGCQRVAVNSKEELICVKQATPAPE